VLLYLRGATERTELDIGASWGQKWAFRTLYQQVGYKAEAEGISVKQGGSAYTSKRCAECGFTAHPEGFEAEFMDKPHPHNAEGV
jgi:hypothetical protein